MVYTSLLRPAWLAWLASCVAGSIHQDAQGIVTIPFERVKTPFNQLGKRDFNKYRPDIRYTIALALGEPPQVIASHLDPTRGYLMVTAFNSSYCREVHCSQDDFYDFRSSSTYKDLGTEFSTTSFGTEFNGSFATETLWVQDALKLPETEIAVNSGSNMGTFVGLGYVGDDSGQYSSYLRSLLDVGRIKIAAYSLYMTTPRSSKGKILIGGVNTPMIAGNLYTMPIPEVNGTHYLPSVLVTGVAGGNKTHTSDLPVYAVLDPGSESTYLPDSIVEKIYKDLGAWVDPDTQQGMFNCTKGEYKNYNVTISFTEFNISVPINKFTLDQQESEPCPLGLLPQGEGTAILGDSFLHSAYVIYDLSHNEISMAGRNSIVDRSNLTGIPAGGVSEVMSNVVSVSITASAPVPTTMLKPRITDFRYMSDPDAPTSTSTSSTASEQYATSTSKGAAAGPTGSPHNLMAGLLGAGMLLAL